MKHTFLNFNKIIAGVLLSSFLSFTTTSASAKSSKKSASTVSFAPQVKYVGTDEAGAALVEVSFESVVPVKFEVSFSDIDGEKVYRQEFESSNFHKTFKLVNGINNYSNFDVTLAVKLLPGGAAHYYNVNSNFELVNSVSINRK